MSDEILTMKNISKRFGGVHALEDVEFACRRGEVHVLAGENGAGKSTILKILAGIHRADSGEIFFRGEQVFIKNPEHSQKLGIAMVFQELTLIGEMTVAENVYLNAEPKNKLGRIDKKEVRRRLFEAMEKYGIRLDPDIAVEKLPVAQQQMAEILKILVREPELIILDEPTSALARAEVEQLYEIIHNLTEAGKTIIFISHRLEEVFRIGDRVTVFKDGHYIGTREIREIDEDKLISMMVGRSLQNIFPPKDGKIGERVIFEVRDLHDSEGKINQVSFEVHEGEILGIAGLQGHGQSEVLAAISGLHPLSDGEIRLHGKPIRVRSATRAIAQGIALVPADRKNQGLMLALSIRHNMSISSLRKRMRGFFIDTSAEKKFTQDMVGRLAIKTGGIDHPANNLSGGNQQKVVLGKELAIEPKVILFDEPTRGIDVEAKREFYTIMRTLAANGVAVVMNSSDMMEVIGVSDRVLVMYEGAVSGVLEKDEISEELIMRLAMGIPKTHGGSDGK